MKVFNEIPELSSESTVAIGTFDGVHFGHRAVLESAGRIAARNKQLSVVFTFVDHPAIITGSKKVPQLLSTSEEKIRLLEAFGLDYCIIIPFTIRLSKMSPEEFVEEILVKKLKARNICVGFNFFFGFKAQGNGETLKQLSDKYGYKAEIIEPAVMDNLTVSSSLIRKELSEAEIPKANHLLGYRYNISGEVIRGRGIGGKVLGIPTANLKVSDRKLLPKDGVYSCIVEVQAKKHKGIVNIGNRPTFDNGAKSIEVHILDFEKDIYNEIIELSIVKFVRDEKKFNGIDELKEQILKDISYTYEVFSSSSDSFKDDF